MARQKKPGQRGQHKIPSCRRHVIKTRMTDEEYADFTGRLVLPGWRYRQSLVYPLKTSQTELLFLSQF